MNIKIKLPLLSSILWSFILLFILFGGTPSRFSIILSYICLISFSLTIYIQDKKIEGLINGKK